MKNLFINLMVLTLAVVNVNSYAQSTTTLDANQFEKQITTIDSVQLLDVRTTGEYNSGHIKNALQADWNDKKEFERRISYIDKNKPVYVYCLSGGRSGAAAKTLNNLGYQIFTLKDGINAWKMANKPLEGKVEEKQMTVEEYNSLTKNDKIVLVDFGAVWCAPCKKMEPILKDLQAKHPNKFKLVKVNGGNDIDVMKQYEVTVLPVFIMYKNGRQVWRKDGIATVNEMEAALKL